MEYRELGRTGWKVSGISLGTWAMGSLWGPVDNRESLAALNRALDLGVNFFDTADVYGSEPLLGQLRRQRREPFTVATKMGMQVNPDVEGYNRKNMTAFVEESLRNVGVEAIDLMQLHCPPIEVYNPETFGILDDLVKQGKIRYYGVSVERIEEAEKAIEYPNVQSVQITTFSDNDHRSFNREGQAFDRGETFSGVDFETGLKAVEELRPLVPAGATMAQMALRWILTFDAVTCAIPGAKRPSQAEDNIRAADLPPLSDSTMEKIRTIYDRHIRAHVHDLW
jgi:aryl-alcohol dehydrogenase-like predicted oxidoreductase